jgi:hypothetical protein
MRLRTVSGQQQATRHEQPLASEHSLNISVDIRNKAACTMRRDMQYLEPIFIDYNILRRIGSVGL